MRYTLKMNSAKELLKSRHRLKLSTTPSVVDANRVHQALSDRQEAITYLEDQTFIHVLTFDLEPPAADHSIDLHLEYQENGMRHLYGDVHPLKNKKQLIEEINSNLSVFCQAKTALMIIVDGNMEDTVLSGD